MKFFKYGVEIFNGMYDKYGGHWQKLSEITRFDYFMIYFCFSFKYFATYYDGYHTIIHLGIIGIRWGGRPFKRDEYH